MLISAPSSGCWVSTDNTRSFGYYGSYASNNKDTDAATLGTARRGVLIGWRSMGVSAARASFHFCQTIQSALQDEHRGVLIDYEGPARAAHIRTDQCALRRGGR